MVAHLVRGIAQHEDDLLRALGNAPQTDSEAVTAEDGENNAHRFTAQLFLYIGGNIVHGGVVALSTGHDSLGHGHYVPVPDGKAILRLCGSFQDGLGDDLHQIVAAADDGSPDAPGYSTDHTAHKRLHSAATWRHT